MISIAHRLIGNGAVSSKLLLCLFAALAVAGCSGSSSDSNQGPPNDPPANRPPTISGTPPTAARVGTPFDFTPIADDADGDTLTFATSHTPPWATFDSATGRLSGVPEAMDVGTTPPITIEVSDGEAQTALSPFTIDVTVDSGDNLALRFFGNGIAAPDLDRVKIRIDDPANDDPGPPVDVGSTDFTIELWMMATASENTAGPITCGAGNDWIRGNIMIDRDRFSQPRAYGVSIADGVLVFGIDGPSASYSLCGSTDVLSGQWHHVALQRRLSDGMLWIHVDGTLEASVDGPDGDVSYPDDGVPGNFCGGPCTNSDPFIVLGAEKHDAGAEFPSYSGYMDELRYSTVLRYGASDFTIPQQRFAPDGDTAALYHFDEGAGTAIDDATPSNASPGELRFGGNPAGPVWELSSAPTD